MRKETLVKNKCLLLICFSSKNYLRENHYDLEQKENDPIVTLSKRIENEYKVEIFFKINERKIKEDPDQRETRYLNELDTVEDEFEIKQKSAMTFRT